MDPVWQRIRLKLIMKILRNVVIVAFIAIVAKHFYSNKIQKLPDNFGGFAEPKFNKVYEAFRQVCKIILKYV